MRYMVIVKADQSTEAGVQPTEAELAEMGAYNEELVKAGVMLAGEGLLDSSKGARVRFDADGGTTVIDGPFAETKEQLLGIYLIDAGDLTDAIQVASRIPAARVGSIEVRPVWDLRGHEPRAQSR